jgi:putative ABC transport system permease protein
MFKSYYKIAFRIFQRQKFYSFINISGLALGLACVIILILWIKNELSYDRYHENADRIYRVTQRSEVDGKVNASVYTPSPLGPAFKNDFPEVEEFVRFARSREVLVQYKEMRQFETIFYADPSIFKIFSFPLIDGNHDNAITDPNSVLISEDMKNKYFSNEDPIGKTLVINNDGEYIVTGVFKNIPSNSHFRFDFLLSFTPIAERRVNQWGISNYYTYILARDNIDIAQFESKIPAFVEKYKDSRSRYYYKTNFPLQRLKSIHLRSNLRGEIEPNNSIENIYLFSAVTLFVLFIACFNYINLATARYTSRTKEVGIRKVLGAEKGQLIRQFLNESVIFSLTALVVAVALVEMFLPVFNSLTGSDLSIFAGNDYDHFAIIILLGILVGIISGSYPAFLLSNYQPVKIFRGMMRTKYFGMVFKRSLVTIQFAISIIFITGTLILYSQLDYLKNKDLGLDVEQILNIPIHDNEMISKIDLIKSEISQNPDIIDVTATSYFPGKNTGYQNYSYDGLSETVSPMMRWISVDEGFIDTYGLELVSGRNITKESIVTGKREYILTESAVKEIGWDEPIGQNFFIGADGVVVGVVKDFHFRSLHQVIEPIALYYYPGWIEYLSVKIHRENISEAIKFLEMKWDETVPGREFSYTFLDEDFGRLYESEKILGKLFLYVAFIAISVSCLGLFGLVAFEARQRNREIGIRKVLGAEVGNILVLFWKEFFSWILIANIFAVPVIYVSMKGWLQNFAYRIEMGWLPFLSGMGIVMFIAIATISIQAARAALQNPVNTLKYE